MASEQESVNTTEGSPTASGSAAKAKRTKQARPIGVYVPRHRRQQQQQQEEEATAAAGWSGGTLGPAGTNGQSVVREVTLQRENVRRRRDKHRADESRRRSDVDAFVQFGENLAAGRSASDRRLPTARPASSTAKSISIVSMEYADGVARQPESERSDQGQTQIATELGDDVNERLAALKVAGFGKDRSNENDDDDDDGSIEFVSCLAPPSEGEEVADWEKILDSDDELPARMVGGKNRSSAVNDAAQRPSTDDLYVDSEPTRSLEVYDFPSTLRTHHIREFFHEYDNIPRGGFKVHWINDTTCVLEFNTAAIAKRAYLGKRSHKMFSIRPYRNIIPTNDNHPDRKLRPITTDMVARRLVQGALGIRARAPKESADAEKAKLRHAREQKDEERRNRAMREEQLERAFFDG